MWRLWCVVILALVCALQAGHAEDRIEYEWRGVPVESLSQWPTFRVQLGHPVFLNGASSGSIVDAAEAPGRTVMGVVSSVVQNVADGVSQAFWGLVRFWEPILRARHELFSRTVDYLFYGPSRSSIRFGTSWINRMPAATEPLAAIIPEPPTMYYKSGLKAKMSFIMERVLKEYRATVVGVPSGTSCFGAVEEQSKVLKEKLKSQLETTLCGKISNGPCTQKFCHFFSLDKDMATNMVFAKLKVNPVEVAMNHIAHNLHCVRTFHSADWRDSVFQTLRLGHRFHANFLKKQPSSLMFNLQEDKGYYYRTVDIVGTAKEKLSKLCGRPTCPWVLSACKLGREHKELFELLFISKFQPWDLAAGSGCRTATSHEHSSNQVDVKAIYPRLGATTSRSGALSGRPFLHVSSRLPFQYRRAMLFRGMVEGDTSMEVHIFGNGVQPVGGQELYFEPLKLLMGDVSESSSKKHDYRASVIQDTLKQGILKSIRDHSGIVKMQPSIAEDRSEVVNQGTEEDAHLIKMSTGNHRAAMAE